MVADLTDLEAIRVAIRRLTRIQREELAEWMLNSTDFQERVAETALAYGRPLHERLVTMHEYLRLEKHSPVRHEYLAGEVFAMGSPLVKHEVIVGNVFGALHGHVRGGSCRTFPSGTRVRVDVETEQAFYYPDIVVACGMLENPSGRDYLDSPNLIVEVLSPSTETVDRREKRLNYRRLASLDEYVVITQQPVHVTVYRREQGWLPIVLSNQADVVHFRSVGLQLPVRQIYVGS